jgi:hypothetical protein
MCVHRQNSYIAWRVPVQLCCTGNPNLLEVGPASIDVAKKLDGPVCFVIWLRTISLCQQGLESEKKLPGRSGKKKLPCDPE